MAMLKNVTKYFKKTKQSAEIVHFILLNWQAHIQLDSYHVMMHATDRVLKLSSVVLDMLVQIYENTNEFNAVTRSGAEGLFNKFDSFDTLAILLLFRDLFEILPPLNLSLQARSIDLLVAMSVVDNASKKLQLLRNSAAQNMIGKAEKLARELKLSST